MRYFSDAPSQLDSTSTLFGTIERYKSRPTWDTSGNLLVNPIPSVITVTTVILDLTADTPNAFLEMFFSSGGRAQVILNVRNNALDNLGSWQLTVSMGVFGFWLNPESTSWQTVQIIVTAVTGNFTSVSNVGNTLILPI